MSFALKSNVRFNPGWDEATWVLPACTFIGLDIADRRALSDWLNGAAGIDTVMDLARRPWTIPGAAAIIGVFETGQDQASWLIVRHHTGWTLASTGDGCITEVMDSLPEVLGRLDTQRAG